MSFENLESLVSADWLLGLLTALGLPRPAYADSVTFTGPSTITLTEDGSTPIFLYTLSNPASGTTLAGLAEIGVLLSTTGDTSDTILFSAFVGGPPATACGSSLAPGSSCTVGIEFFLPSGAGETDADSGTQVWQVGFSWTGNGAAENLTITINDPAVAAPEPSSLLLLGSGLFMLSLAWFGAWRETRAS